jgi:hypothetical protein
MSAPWNVSEFLLGLSALIYRNVRMLIFVLEIMIQSFYSVGWQKFELQDPSSTFHMCEL